MEVSVTPEMLYFPRPHNRTIENTLTIVNHGNTPLTFKLKTTSPAKYVVRPRVAILAPKESMRVRVTSRPHEKEDASGVTKDRFLLEVRAVGAEDAATDAKTLWSRPAQTGAANYKSFPLACAYNINDPPPNASLRYGVALPDERAVSEAPSVVPTERASSVAVSEAPSARSSKTSAAPAVAAVTTASAAAAAPVQTRASTAPQQGASTTEVQQHEQQHQAKKLKASQFQKELDQLQEDIRRLKAEAEAKQGVINKRESALSESEKQLVSGGSRGSAAGGGVTGPVFILLVLLVFFFSWFIKPFVQEYAQV